MKKKLYYPILSASLLFLSTVNAQVGIGTTTPRGALDINSSTSGFVPPQVSLTSLIVAAPVVNPQGGALARGTIVWNTNTAGVLPNNVSPGLYYWNGTRWISVAGSPGGLDWSIIGNGGIDGGVTGATGVTATQGANFIGTYDNTNVDIRTNGRHAARVSALGEFFIGALETVLPGDLMNGVSEGNASFPWAINGYTDQNGAGVYGSVTGGTTNFAGVQGEYKGSGTRGAGVRGIVESTAAGSGLTSFNAGVAGDLSNNNDWAFGVAGRTVNSTGKQVGGVLGTNTDNGTYAMLGYERSNGADCAVLGSVNYVRSTARNQADGTTRSDASIGLGIQGGFLGGHVKGDQYGLITKGNRFGLYTDGATITNKTYAVVNENEGAKIVTYATTSTTMEVSAKGVGKLVNGKAQITFDKNYSDLIAKNKPTVVTVTPMGETNGVYVTSVNTDGFTIKENNKGTSTADFYWIAISEKKDAEAMAVPQEVLANDFNKNLDSFLTIDEQAKETSKAMWWNGSSLEFGKQAPSKPAQEKTAIELDNRKGERKSEKRYLRK
ncbi:hypothetical protein LZZ90_03770 [Flavobacterium sp. SM15]|uniref:hypothetical protein n=1 Tax=Flavobacterium sp. SM15 TaxID=2908005 RepID=UPI001EDACAD2|nr:hypothetical protein [Flavobacterium sp. SM15]MCG2610620.1 hypothetical protein [Flavobacterium sp. SM15]